MRAMYMIIALAACDAGKQAPKQPSATGSLVFDIGSRALGEQVDLRRDDGDVLLATEAKVIRAASLIERVREDQRTTELAADDITVKREPGAMILYVSVHHPDVARAAQLCNALMRSYIGQRIESKLMPIMQQQQALTEQLERNPENQKLREQLDELQLSRTMHTSDVRVLDNCKATRR